MRRIDGFADKFRWSFERPCAEMPITPMVDVDMEALDTCDPAGDGLFVVVVPHNTTNSSSIVDPQFVETVDYMLHKKIKTLLRSRSMLGQKLSVLELSDEADAGAWGRKIGASIASILKTEKDVSPCTIVLPPHLANVTAFLTECSASILGALYEDKRYKSSIDESSTSSSLPEKITFVSSTMNLEGASAALRKGSILATGVYLSKDIVNAPHNSLNSLGLANLAKHIASQSRGRLTCRILDMKDCEKLGMGAFLGVARGSETPPQFIHLSYRPPRGTKSKKLGIVGKGLLMDTGGYSIKTQMVSRSELFCFSLSLPTLSFSARWN